MEHSDTPQYPMRVVSRRTSLSPHVIRVWERRYGAVVPPRTGTNRRLYSDEDIRRLSLLRQATIQGHSIGLIAKRTIEELDSLVKSGTAFQHPASPTETAVPAVGAREGEFVRVCIDAIFRMDRRDLEDALGQASTEYTIPELLEHLLGPLMERVGKMWRDGDLRVSHEHFASDTVKSFLSARRAAHVARSNAPTLVLTTPAGQVHEIGALMAAVMACADGWRDMYLGPNLPAEDIIAAVRASGARAVALSLVYPADDPSVSAELLFLRRHLPEEITIFVGGRASEGYREALAEIGAVVCPELRDFRLALDQLRTSVSPRAAV